MGDTLKILVVDDDKDIVEILQYNLKNSGYSVKSANNGIEAIKKAKKFLPDVILMDVMMPEMSGIEACSEIKEIEELSNTIIIFLSARREDYTQISAYDAGADDYISKPFSPRELVSRVKALLRRSRPALTGDVLEFADVKLFPKRVEVERAGHMVALGPKEFHLLSILIERPSQVFSRSQLLDLVWGHGVYVEERTVDVHLSRLRKALNKPDGRTELPNLIRTVRGSGYALRAPQ